MEAIYDEIEPPHGFAPFIFRAHTMVKPACRARRHACFRGADCDHRVTASTKTHRQIINMNPERLSKMQSQVRIGGKGTQRRKKKVVHKTNTDDKKLQNSLKKLAVNAIPGIEEVHMIKDDGHVIHFNNPKVQASLPANTFAITGHAETKPVTDLVPRILNTDQRNSDEGDDDVPELVGDFDSTATKSEVEES